MGASSSFVDILYHIYLKTEKNIVFEETISYLRVSSNAWVPVYRSGNTLVYDGEMYYTKSGDLYLRKTSKCNIVFDTFMPNTAGFLTDQFVDIGSIPNAMFVKIEENMGGVRFYIRQYSDQELAELQLRADIDYLLFLGGHSSSAQEKYSAASLSKLAIPNLGISTTANQEPSTVDNSATEALMPLFKKYYQFGLWDEARLTTLVSKSLLTSSQKSSIMGGGLSGTLTDDDWYDIPVGPPDPAQTAK